MADFGWSAEKVEKAFEELSRIGFAYRFESIVLLPNFLRWNRIANPKVAKCRQGEFEALPKGEARARLARAMLEFGNHWSNEFERVLETVSQTVCDTRSKQDPTPPEPNLPDPEPTRDTSAAPTAVSGAVERVFEHWQVTWGHPNAALDSKRKRVIAEALKSYSEADLCQCIAGYRYSPHHTGQNDRATVYDSIELFLRDAKHIDAGLKFYAHPPRSDLSEATRRVISQTETWEPPEARHAAN
jgi:hypothetical protein